MPRNRVVAKTTCSGCGGPRTRPSDRLCNPCRARLGREKRARERFEAARIVEELRKLR